MEPSQKKTIETIDCIFRNFRRGDWTKQAKQVSLNVSQSCQSQVSHQAERIFFFMKFMLVPQL